MTINILFIDNFDSFSFNLVDEFARRGCHLTVWRNEVSAAFAMEKLEAMNPPRLVVISPGPGHPTDAGCCIPLIRALQDRAVLFGVCLGHQALVEAHGGEVGVSGQVVHGKASPITHNGRDLFRDLPSPLLVGRYHSLVAKSIPPTLEVQARRESTIMAVRHRTLPHFGVQFHPESILTPRGGQLIDNLIHITKGMP